MAPFVASKFIVRMNTQLTSLACYVYCSAEHTAQAVAECFNKKTREITQYNWTSGGPTKTALHWCVVEDNAWELARASEVRPGQWYIGAWADRKSAGTVLENLLHGKDKVDEFLGCVGPSNDNPMHYVIVSTAEHAEAPEDLVLRSDIKVGEAFMYMNATGKRRIAVEVVTKDYPKGWMPSIQKNAMKSDSWIRRVKRIPHWDAGKAKEIASPRILPCVDPMERYTRICAEKRDGLTGLKHLELYEKNMREDEPLKFCPEGLKFAKEVWSAKLAVLTAQQKATDAAKARENELTCEDQDEMPNMVFVES